MALSPRLPQTSLILGHACQGGNWKACRELTQVTHQMLSSPTNTYYRDSMAAASHNPLSAGVKKTTAPHVFWHDTTVTLGNHSHCGYLHKMGLPTPHHEWRRGPWGLRLPNKLYEWLVGVIFFSGVATAKVPCSAKSYTLCSHQQVQPQWIKTRHKNKRVVLGRKCSASGRGGRR